METVHEIDVNAPAATAWMVLGEQFGAIDGWAATALEGDLGVGAVRSCEGRGFGPFPPGLVSERLTHFDREGRSFAYEATRGLPPFVRSAQNRWTIEPNGTERCVVRMRARVLLAWWARRSAS